MMTSSYVPKEQRGSEYVFATLSRADNVIEIRRGGGIAFELSVLLQVFVLLNIKNEQLE